MFSSMFSVTESNPHASNLEPVSSRFSGNDLYGELEAKDTEWTCASGFATETQTFYVTTADGISIMLQVVHAAVGLWYPTITFNAKVFDPKVGKTWKTVNVSNFVTPPGPGFDKRSSKADEFSIYYKSTPDAEHPEQYAVRATLGTELIIALDFLRPSGIPGFKIGKGPEGGFTYYGTNNKKPDGYIIHRFWPRTSVTGSVIVKGKAQTIEGAGIFIHAIQGMRPDQAASAWNFVNFHSDSLGGVSAMQMEHTTQPTHGRKGKDSGGVKVNIGSIVVAGKLVALTAETKWPDEDYAADSAVVSRTTQLKFERDPDTGYNKPSEFLYEWKGPSIVAEAPGSVEAKLSVDVGTVAAPKGLIEKVDLLAEIPYVVKMAVSYVAGTKPYIYQWANPTKLHVKGPDAISPGLSEGLEIDGILYNEATFISGS